MLKGVKKTISINSVYKSKKSFFDKNRIIPKKENECRFVFEQNGINLFDILVNISKNQKVKNLIIISYRISKQDLSFLEEMMKLNLIPKTKLFISDSIPQMVVGTYNYLKNNSNFETNYINTHAKTVLLDCGKNKYILTSSGNFGTTGKTEQTTIIKSIKLHKEICQEVEAK
jgi:hypothetical protein